MSSDNWKPRMGLVRLEYCYYVDLDDEDMVEQAKDMIIDDVSSFDLDLRDFMVVKPATKKDDPQSTRDWICDYLLECQQEHLLEQGKCPFCKGSTRRVNPHSVRCGPCDESFDWDE